MTAWLKAGRDAEKRFRRLIEENYAVKRPRSCVLHEEACKYMPGGDTRTATYFEPFPHYIERGEGSYIYDADGNKLFDFQNNYTSLIHGHAHGHTVKAICEQIALGSAFTALLNSRLPLLAFGERFPALSSFGLQTRGLRPICTLCVLPEPLRGRQR